MVDDGQYLFFGGVRVLDGDFLLFFFCRGRSGVPTISKGVRNSRLLVIGFMISTIGYCAWTWHAAQPLHKWLGVRRNVFSKHSACGVLHNNLKLEMTRTIRGQSYDAPNFRLGYFSV